MSKTIMITSGKGGVGKTTVCAALGKVLGEQGHMVLLVDGDLGLRDLDLVLGVQDEVLFTTTDVWLDACFIEDAMIHVTDNIDFLPASQKYRWEDVKRGKLGKLLKKYGKPYDYILVDCPAGIGRGMEAVLPMMDEVCIVVEPNWMSIRDAQRVIQFLKDHKVRRYHIIINKMPTEREQRLLTADEMADTLGADYIGALLPLHASINKANHEGSVHELFEVNSFANYFAPLVEMLEAEECWEINDVIKHFEENKMTKAAHIAVTLQSAQLKYGVKHDEYGGYGANPSVSRKAIRQRSLWKWSRGGRRR